MVEWVFSNSATARAVLRCNRVVYVVIASSNATLKSARNALQMFESDPYPILVVYYQACYRVSDVRKPQFYTVGILKTIYGGDHT